MATVGLVLVTLGPATVAADTAGNDSLDVAVEQAGNAGPTVTVTENETGVENASVTVEALDNGSYEGVGENYTTSENGTVALPAPEENVTVQVDATYNNTTASTTAELTTVNETADPENFGTDVSAFVQSVLDGESENVGQQVATYVTENNPGNAPAHAGPPEDGERGPPEHAGPSEADDNETDEDARGNGQGPPEHAGPPEADEDNESDEDTRGNGQGPPEHAGPPEADDNETDDRDDTEMTEEEETEEEEETDEEETGEEEETEEEETEEDGERGGPPENANAGGNGNGN